MRVADRAFPPVVRHPLTNPTVAGWPVRPVIAIAQTPTPPYGWDDSEVWDDAALVWDAPSVTDPWRDASCVWSGLEIDTGEPDDAGLWPSTRLVCQLENGDGSWSRFNVDGTPTDAGPGSTIAVWAELPDESDGWWLFYGTIARYDQRADDTIEIEAFDVFSDLAQPVGTYTPGTVAQLPGARLAAIVAASAAATTARTRFAVGTNPLTRQPTDLAPLEEAQTVTSSDGGLLYSDADGTLVSTDRGWRDGRTDQTAVPAVSWNVCGDGLAPVWDPVLSTTDTLLADAVVLENIAELHAVAGTPTAGRYVITATGHQWTTQGDGDTLAAWLLANQSTGTVRLDAFDVWLMANPDGWQAVDWRLLDRLRFVHDQSTPDGTARLDLTFLVLSIVHAITADNWIATFSTTRAIDYATALQWDNTVYVWDQIDPANVWSF